MKRVYIIGRDEEAKSIEKILKTVNAGCLMFQSLERAMDEARVDAPNMFVLAYEIPSINDSALQKLKKDYSLSSIPVLVCYPAATRNAEARGRILGANEIIQTPVDRRELLSRTSSLLHVERRRRFQTLVTIETNEARYMGRSEDFSPTGFSFQCEYDLPESQEVMVGFFLPSSAERVRVPSLIVRKAVLQEGRFFYGAQFVEVREEIAEKIKNFVEKTKA